MRAWLLLASLAAWGLAAGAHAQAVFCQDAQGPSGQAYRTWVDDTLNCFSTTPGGDPRLKAMADEAQTGNVRFCPQTACQIGGGGPLPGPAGTDEVTTAHVIIGLKSPITCQGSPNSPCCAEMIRAGVSQGAHFSPTADLMHELSHALSSIALGRKEWEKARARKYRCQGASEWVSEEERSASFDENLARLSPCTAADRHPLVPPGDPGLREYSTFLAKDGNPAGRAPLSCCGDGELTLPVEACDPSATPPTLTCTDPCIDCGCGSPPGGFPSTATVAVMGDTQSLAGWVAGGSQAIWEETLQGIVDADVDALLLVGDVVESPGDWQVAGDAYGLAFDASGISLYAQIGNHDYSQASPPFFDHDGFDAWRAARTDPGPANNECWLRQLTTDWYVLQLEYDFDAADETCAESLLATVPSGGKVILLSHHCAAPDGTVDQDTEGGDCTWLETQNQIRMVLGGHWPDGAHIESNRSHWSQSVVNGRTLIVGYINGQNTDNDEGLLCPTCNPAVKPGVVEYGNLRLVLTPTSARFETWHPADDTTTFTGRFLWGGQSITDSQPPQTFTVD